MNEETKAVEEVTEEILAEKLYSLTLSEGSVNQILGVLGKQPYTEVSETISTIFQNTKLIEDDTKEESPVE